MADVLQNSISLLREENRADNEKVIKNTQQTSEGVDDLKKTMKDLLNEFRSQAGDREEARRESGRSERRSGPSGRPNDTTGGSVMGLLFGLPTAILGFTQGLLLGWSKAIKDSAKLIAKVITGTFRRIVIITRSFFTGFFKLMKSGFTLLSASLGKLEIVKKLKAVGSSIRASISNVFTNLIKSFRAGLNGVTRNVVRTIGGQFKRMNVFEKFARSVGRFFKPVADGIKSISAFATRVSTQIGKIVASVRAGFTTATKTVGSIATRIGTFFTSIRAGFTTATKTVGSIATRIGTFFTSIRTSLTTMATTIRGGLSNVITKAVKGIQTIVKPIQGAFQTISAAFASFGTTTRSVGGLFSRIFGGIGKTFSSIIKPMQNVVAYLRNVAPGIFKAFSALGRLFGWPLTIAIGLYSGIKESLESFRAGDILGGVMKFLTGAINGAILSLADLIKDGISWIAKKIFGEDNPVSTFLDSFDFTEMFSTFMEKATTFLRAIPEKISAMWTAINEWWDTLDPLGWLIDPIERLITGISEFVKGLIPSVSSVKKFFGFGDDEIEQIPEEKKPYAGDKPTRKEWRAMSDAEKTEYRLNKIKEQKEFGGDQPRKPTREEWRAMSDYEKSEYRLNKIKDQQNNRLERTPNTQRQMNGQQAQEQSKENAQAKAKATAVQVINAPQQNQTVNNSSSTAAVIDNNLPTVDYNDRSFAFA